MTKHIHPIDSFDLSPTIMGDHADGMHESTNGGEWVAGTDNRAVSLSSYAPSLNMPGDAPRSAVVNMLSVALWYAKYGWPVIPIHEPLFDADGRCVGCTCEEWRRRNGKPSFVCDTPGKHPHIKDWENRATVDPMQIDKWWHAWPSANIGIAAGRAGLVVVDKDTYQSAAEGEELTIADTETVTSLTGGGGEHLIYRHPQDGPRISNADKSLPEWVNIRAHGGLFVAPPSLHKSGNRYEWEPGYGPHEIEPAELPPALRALLQPAEEGQRWATPIPERIAEGGRNNTLTSLAGGLRRRGIGGDVIEAALLEVNAAQCDPPLPTQEVHAIAKSVSRYAPTALCVNGNGGTISLSKSSSALPQIIVGNRHLRDMSENTYSVLLAANDPPAVYQYGSQLARVTAANGQAGVQLYDKAMLRHRLSRVADFMTVKILRDGTQQQSCVPIPDQLTADILAYPEWPNMPTLNGIVTAPVVGPSGQVHVEEGYDPATGLFYHAGGKLKIGDITPTPRRVAWAVGLIMDDLLHDFPFKDASSKANAVALYILPFARPLIEGCTPLHILSAPTPGTGKTLAARIVTLPFNPDGPAVLTAAEDEDEWRKRITSLLSGGTSHLLIDNIKGALVSASLAAALSTALWTDRILGKIQTITLPNRAVWIATGNNIAVDVEMARRSVWIRLDANAERPWTRTGFKHASLGEWTLENRGDLVTAALVLIMHWVTAGCPPGRASIGGFESWARVIGGILDSAGIVGFMGNAEELYEQSDPTAALWPAFLAEWWKQYQGAPIGVKQLFPLADSEPADGITGLGLLDAMLTGPTVRSRQVRLGKLLQDRLDTVIDGFKIQSSGKLHGAGLYQLAQLGM